MKKENWDRKKIENMQRDTNKKSREWQKDKTNGS